jgi:hypothetical protein
MTQTVPREVAFATHEPSRSRRWVTALFGGTILLGSAMLFLVEPMVAKMLLPRLGGVPAVWNTALVFFQILLLAGYAWAHLTSTRLGLRRLVVAQVGLFIVAAALLPVGIPEMWVPSTTAPVRWALVALGVAVGLPFFALSTASPILQRWYSKTDQRKADDPYFLYAASNVGSLIGLLGYPLVVEPTLTLDEQATVWTGAFIVLVCLVALCGVTAVARRRASDSRAGAAEDADVPPIAPRLRLRWIALAAVPSALLLGVTHFLSTDIAAIPLLWVIPLTLYLATFVVAFGPNPSWLRDLSARVLKLLVVPLAVSLVAFVPLVFDVALSLVVFTAAALVTHGELAASRPHTARLTEFYMLVSVGGAVGGMLVALVAPVVFPVVLEYPLALAAALVFLPAALFGSTPGHRQSLGIVIVLGSVVLVGVIVALRASDEASGSLVLLTAVGVAGYVLARRPWHYAAAIGVALVLATVIPLASAELFDRSFFGTLRVEDTGSERQIVSGSTVHGAQALDPALAGEPRTYYHRSGPIGDVFSLRDDSAHSTAVIGLGAGAVAAYGRPGDTQVYLEIDPLVAEVASDPRYFTFLSESEASTEIRLGDGRLLLEAADERYDLVVLDAFTSDAIPVHLLTLEAMDAYERHLADGGLIAYHVSNRYLDLAPVLARQADELGLTIVGKADGTTPEQVEDGKWESTWVLISADRASVAELLADRGWVALNGGEGPLWTDDYSNLLQVMHFS